MPIGHEVSEGIKVISCQKHERLVYEYKVIGLLARIRCSVTGDHNHKYRAEIDRKDAENWIVLQINYCENQA